MARNDANLTRRINLYINGKEIKNQIGSIRGELNKSIAAISKMTIGSKEYNQEAAKIARLQSILRSHREEISGTQSVWKSLSSTVSKYWGLVVAGGAAFFGAFRGVQKLTDDFDKFNESLQNLSALTGLQGKELEFLANKAKETSYKVTDAGVVITQSAEEILDAYTKMGSQRPELLKDAAALAEVTEQGIILSEAAKMQLDPAISALATTLNQFNEPASESGRIINILAAGSKEGAGDIPYLTAAMEKSGTTANLMGISIENMVGTIEAIAPKFAEASLAGNSLDKVLLKMKEKNIGYQSGVFNLADAINELQVRFRNGESAATIFGVEHAKMAEVLVMNKSEIERYTDAVTGTNIALEQAVTNTNTDKKAKEQALNQIKVLSIELGEKLSPAVTKSTQLWAKLLQGLIKAPAFISENRVLLQALAAAVVVYYSKSITLMAQELLLRGKAIVLAGAEKAMMIARVMYTQAYVAATGQATMAQKRLLVAAQQNNLAWAMNPFGAAVAGLMALYLAVKAYDKYNATAIAREKEKKMAIDSLSSANDTLKKSYEAIAGQMTNLNRLSATEKKDLQEKLDLTLDNALAELELAKAKQEQIRVSHTDVSVWDRVVTALTTGGNAYLATAKNVEKAFENGNKAAEEMDEGINTLKESINSLRSQKTDLGDILNAEAIGDAISGDSITALEEKLAKYNVALKNAVVGSDDFIRVQAKMAETQKALNKLQDAGYSPEAAPEKDDKKLNEEFERAQQKVAEALASIREKMHLDSVSANEREILEVEYKYAELLSLAEQYGLDETQITSLKENELASLKTKHAQQELDAKKKLQDQLAQLTESDTDREIRQVTEKYMEIIEAAKAMGLDVTDAYARVQEEIKAIQDSEEPTDIFGMTPESWDEMFQSFEMALEYLNQMGDIWGSVNTVMNNKDKKQLIAFEKNNKKQKDLLAERLGKGVISQEQYNAQVAKLDSDLDKKKEEVQKKQAEREKKLALFNVAVNTAAAIMRIWADVPKADFGVSTAILTGLALASGIAQAAAIASAPPAYAEGGFTTGDKIYRAGEEGTEWIGNNKLVNDPYTGPVIAALEAVQRGKAPATIFSGAVPAFTEMQAIPAFAAGGYTSTATAPVINNYNNSTSTDAMIARLDMMIEENRLLRGYLSDPRNRRAFISQTDLDRARKEEEMRNSLGKIG
ncbi:MAG: phage tail tape measure protein [Breznakibacter sp.]